MPSRKEQVNFRISDQGKTILYGLQDHYGLSQSGVFELLLREKARQVKTEEGVDLMKTRLGGRQAAGGR